MLIALSVLYLIAAGIAAVVLLLVALAILHTLFCKMYIAELNGEQNAVGNAANEPLSSQIQQKEK